MGKFIIIFDATQPTLTINLHLQLAKLAEIYAVATTHLPHWSMLKRVTSVIINCLVSNEVPVIR